MRAFVIRGPHQAGIEDAEVPSPQPGEGLVSVRQCGICGSDLHAYEGTQPFFRFPQVPGHGVVGDLVEVRPGPWGALRLPGRPIDETLEVGRRVVLDPGMPCGTCYPCVHGRYNCCESMRVVGVHAPGALAEYYTAPLECLHSVPDSLDDELAALVEPVSIGLQANNRARTCSDDHVLVIGAGTIGLCVTMVAKSRGAHVAVSDPSASRREAALRLGADLALDPGSDGFRQALGDFAQATGPSVVVEAVGKPGTVAQALDLAVAAGRVVLLGLISDEIRLPGSVLVRKELDFVGSRLHGGTVPSALELLDQGHIRPSGLVTHRLELHDAERGLLMMGQSPDDVLKVIVGL